MTEPANPLAGLRPRLNPGVRVVRHTYRGRPWFVLSDPASSRHHRLDEAAHSLLARMDGKRTVAELADVAGEGGREEAIMASAELLAQLHAADLVRFDEPSEPREALLRQRALARRRRRERWLRPLTIRFPLVDPDAWLDRTVPRVRCAFTSLAGLLWLGLVGAGLASAFLHWPELGAHWAARGIDPRTAALMVLVYPFLKGLHELGHAYAIKVRGGEVHEMGIMLVVFLPLPYVDASAASAFPRKRDRMLVGAAGIVVELAIAAAALLVWSVVPGGLAADLAYSLALVGGASTVLFNANPLLRFDGYYILSDALEIPNLGPRATRSLAHLAERHLLGLADAPSPAGSPSERAWLIAYGLGSFAYRIVLTAVIALYVAGKAFVLGVLLAAWFIGAQIGLPMARAITYLARSQRLSGRRARAVAVSLGTIAVLGGLTSVPFASFTSAEGLVRQPEGAVVRAESEGFAAGLAASDGARVRRGQPLLVLDNAELLAQVRLLELERSELETRRTRELLVDRVRAEVAREELARVDSRLLDARIRLDELTVKSPADGVLVIPREKRLLGRFVHQGEIVAYVSGRAATARIIVPQADIARVREESRAVRVKLVTRPGVTLEGTLFAEVPSGSERLPSQALGSLGGGRIPVDGRDASGVRALERVFEVDVRLPERDAAYPIGARVLVRFEHGREPLARQWYRDVRRLLLVRFQI